ncbi:hypothetical protein SVIOM74S_07419 [Streptomyces violarus]
MALVDRVLRVAGQEQAYVRGDVGAALVLLPGQAARRAPAVVQGEPGAGQSAVEAVGLGALFLQLLLGGVVGLGGLFGLPVMLLKVRQKTGDGGGVLGGGGMGGSGSGTAVAGAGARTVVAAVAATQTSRTSLPDMPSPPV